MLGRGALDKLNFILVDAARRIATADNLDAIDLFAVVLLLNQTHIVYVLPVLEYHDYAT